MSPPPAAIHHLIEAPPLKHYRPSREALRELFYALAPTQAQQAERLGVTERCVKRWLAARSCKTYSEIPRGMLELARRIVKDPRR